MRNNGLSFFSMALHCGFPGTSECGFELIEVTETGLAIFKAALYFKNANLYA
jgi:hypothetical protein